MLVFLRNFFSRYAHPFERKVDSFVRSLRSTSKSSKIQKELEVLMQENLVVLNLFLEMKTKRYKNLSKSMRRRLYKNTELLVKDFMAFAEAQNAEVRSSTHLALEEKERLSYIGLIMEYLKPGKRYLYREASAFSLLLKNPAAEQLVGDCNQIVTLFAYLYSLKYAITDLQLKFLPQHVCLHFKGFDIEATDATFQKYEKYEAIAPITELIAANMLDVADAEVAQGGFDPRTFLKTAQLAHAVSSQREIVEKNLKVAYQNLGSALLKQGDFEGARFYFEKVGNPSLMNAVHSAEFNALAAKVHGVKTLKEARNFRHHYQKMLSLARLMGAKEQVQYLEKVLKQIA